MSRHFANEADFHQRLIDNPDAFPALFRGTPAAHTLFWAHELTLHDAGRGGGNGSADLLTVDEIGMVWLIEVKFNFSLESGTQVWHGQLARYRKALMTMSWQEIVRYTHRFLTGFEQTKPQLLLRRDAVSLDECIVEWLVAVQADAVSGVSIVSNMAERLRSGNFGIMLVSDYFNASDLAAAKSFADSVHSGPVAYAVINPDPTGFHWHVKYFRPEVDQSSVTGAYVTSDFLPEKMPLVTPARLRSLVSPACRYLLDTLIYPRLHELGWDERHVAKRSAFDVIIPVGGRSLPLLVVGTSELDAKALERHTKIDGGQTLKINPRFKAVLNHTGNLAFVNAYMKRFYELGWRGRRRENKNLRWGVTDISAAEIGASEAAMIYYPFENQRDHSGREGDAENLSNFLAAFAEMIASIPEATLNGG
ncbi:hypothetical protein [Mesorhizobium sp. M7A.F.Ca.US.010.02.1.1]|uniref:hypothetical protein n=1 Tax=Mesorhizobium sp. M7A.F.Ca.US.010.02.1.1 TaxID=2496743 RepID=UPI000FD3DE66|nr:hypothetical protein [Mesorhizobium sp. M7A.F.Ca.US.010.02.1.1]RUW94409.1 hypothetical protein EOA19_03445 [Mesorhizobium sp. M7A.F.Ca.US.010.02.1.1]